MRTPLRSPLRFLSVRLRARRILSHKRARLAWEFAERFSGDPHEMSAEDAEQLGDIAAQLALDNQRETAQEVKILRACRRAGMSDEERARLKGKMEESRRKAMIERLLP